MASVKSHNTRYAVEPVCRRELYQILMKKGLGNYPASVGDYGMFEPGVHRCQGNVWGTPRGKREPELVLAPYEKGGFREIRRGDTVTIYSELELKQEPKVLRMFRIVGEAPELTENDLEMYADNGFWVSSDEHGFVGMLHIDGDGDYAVDGGVINIRSNSESGRMKIPDDCFLGVWAPVRGILGGLNVEFALGSLVSYGVTNLENPPDDE
jgi:hypothetical protein